LFLGSKIEVELFNLKKKSPSAQPGKDLKQLEIPNPSKVSLGIL
jgi:hypothetical protein